MSQPRTGGGQGTVCGQRTSEGHSSEQGQRVTVGQRSRHGLKTSEGRYRCTTLDEEGRGRRWVSVSVVVGAEASRVRSRSESESGSESDDASSPSRFPMMGRRDGIYVRKKQREYMRAETGKRVLGGMENIKSHPYNSRPQDTRTKTLALVVFCASDTQNSPFN